MSYESEELQLVRERLAGVESQLRHIKWCLIGVFCILVCLVVAPFGATLFGVVLPLIVAALVLGYFVYLMRARRRDSSVVRTETVERRTVD